MDYDTCQPLAILFDPGAVPDSQIFSKMINELKRRKILKKEDKIIADKGYVLKSNYINSILNHKIVPIIFHRKNMKKKNILKELNFPLECYSRKKDLMPIYKRIVKKFSAAWDNWKDFKKIRGKIEDFFKFMKNGVGYQQIPAFTYKSLAKTSYLNVLLAGLIVSVLKPDNKKLQQLSEM